MKFTVNIPVTRKRTKHGYYIVHAFGREFFKHRAKALRWIKDDLKSVAADIKLITVRDYAKKTKSKPPA